MRPNVRTQRPPEAVRWSEGLGVRIMGGRFTLEAWGLEGQCCCPTDLELGTLRGFPQ